MVIRRKIYRRSDKKLEIDGHSQIAKRPESSDTHKSFFLRIHSPSASDKILNRGIIETRPTKIRTQRAEKIKRLRLRNYPTSLQNENIRVVAVKCYTERTEVKRSFSSKKPGTYKMSTVDSMLARW